MSAVRRSHSTLSKGDTSPSVKRRLKSRPVRRAVVCSNCEFKIILVSAISASAPAVLPPKKLAGVPSREELQLQLYSPKRNPENCCVYRAIHELRGFDNRGR